MNKLKAADKLAEAVDNAVVALIGTDRYANLENYILSDDYNGTGLALKYAVNTYRQASAIPLLERILEAMETLNKIALGAKYVKTAASSAVIDTLIQLREAVKHEH